MSDLKSGFSIEQFFHWFYTSFYQIGVYFYYFIIFIYWYFIIVIDLIVLVLLFDNWY